MHVALFPRSDPKDEGSGYVDLIGQGLTAVGIDLVDFKAAVSGAPVDAVILNWPENRWVRRSKGWREEREDRTSLLRALRMLRARGATVLWTAHNTVPHRWDDTTARWVSRSRALWRHIDGVIHLTQASLHDPAFAHLAALPSAVVPHPHYALIDPDHHRRRAGAIERLLFLGGTDPRKGVRDVLPVVLAVPHLTVLITGTDAGWTANALTEGGADALQDGRIVVRIGWLSHDEVNGLFDGHTAVLLGQRTQLNSGVALHALSRGAPVIAPRTATNEELATEVGSDWMRLHDAPITADALTRLVAAPVPAVLPDLSARSPRRIGEATAQALRDVARGSTGTPTSR